MKYKRYTKGKIDLSKLSEKAKAIISDTYIKYTETNNALCDLEDKIENGTLIELPCKAGDTVYQVTSLYGVFEYRIESLQALIWLKEQDMFGKWLFTTKAEAEQKLKELQEQVG